MIGLVALLATVSRLEKPRGLSHLRFIILFVISLIIHRHGTMVVNVKLVDFYIIISTVK